MLLATIALSPANLPAEQVSKPGKHRVKLRFHINSPLEQRIKFYGQMIKRLKELGLETTPPLKYPPPLRDSANVKNNRLEGVIAVKNGPALATVPFVANVLLIPENFKLPVKPDKLVHVQLDLQSGFGKDQQREFRAQTRALLWGFGFDEAVGYDSRNSKGQPDSRLRGTMPVNQMEVLLKDLRFQPTGWFAPRIPPAELPAPLKSANPVRLITILPDPAPPLPPAGPVQNMPAAAKILSPLLWQLATTDPVLKQPLRIEMVFKITPKDNVTVRTVLQKSAPALVIEGILGNTATGVFGRAVAGSDNTVRTGPYKIGKQLRSLAAIEYMSCIRLAEAEQVAAAPGVRFTANDAMALKKSGLDMLHNKGHRGKGKRILIIDSDFRGYQDLLKNGRLNKKTRFFDLTSEQNANLLADPHPVGKGNIGHGAQCALAAALAAPEAELLLLRIDPAAPQMLARVADLLRRRTAFSPSLVRRYEEMEAAGNTLELRRKKILDERRQVLLNFDDEGDAKLRYGILGKVRGWLFSPREWHRARWNEFEKDRRAHHARRDRLLEYFKSLNEIKDVDVVSCSLVWNTGRPAGGLSALTRTIDDSVRRRPQTSASATARRKKTNGDPPFWFHAAGNTRGQCWNDAWRDDDGDGVMEFAGPKFKLPQGRWTRELNFLAWKPLAGGKLQELPANSTFRASLQWTEPHDPDYFFKAGERDWYERPLAEMRVRVLRQRAAKDLPLPKDAFEEIAISRVWPKRLRNTPQSSTYELYVEWTTTKPGRYALRIEKPVPFEWIVVKDKNSAGLRFVKLAGLSPIGLRPLGTAVLPALAKKWELNPRLFLEVRRSAQAGAGRPVLQDFFTDRGSIGIPADGRAIIAVGAARFDGNAESFSALGPPANLDLFISPRIFAYSRIGGSKHSSGPAFGTSLAAPFAAGMCAAVLSSGAPPAQVHGWLSGSSKRRILKAPNR